MHTRLAILLSFFVLPTSHLKAQAQPTNTEQAVQIAYSTEFHVTQTWPTPGGQAKTQERTEFNEFDAYGRTVYGSRFASSGITSFTVDDPIEGVRIVWNTAVPTAKVLHYPNPVPGRKSCWKVTPEDAKVERGDPQFGVDGATCLPAGQHQLPNCKQTATSRGVRDNVAEPLPATTIVRPSCDHLGFGKDVEDLGTNSIAGYDTQGCRAENHASMKYVSSWSIELDAGRLRRNVWVRSEQESPSGVKTLMELNNLTLTAPNPKAFQAPEKYEIKNINMVEVDCTPNGTVPNDSVKTR